MFEVAKPKKLGVQSLGHTGPLGYLVSNTLLLGSKGLMLLWFFSFAASANAAMDCLTAFEYSSLCTSQNPAKFQHTYGAFYQDTPAALVITPISPQNTGDGTAFKPVLFHNIHSEESDHQHHVVVAALPRLDMLLIQTRYYEGYSLTLVSYRNGETYPIGGAPLLSPDQRYLLVYAEDIEAQYSANLLSVYKVGDFDYGKVLMQQYHSVGSDAETVWGVGSARWLSNNKAEIEKVRLGDKGPVKSLHYLQNSETGWFETQATAQEKP